MYVHKRTRLGSEDLERKDRDLEKLAKESTIIKAQLEMINSDAQE